MAAVVADDKTATRDEEPFEDAAQVPRGVVVGDDVEEHVDVVESPGGLPVPGVADEEVVRAVGEALAREVDQARALVEPVRRQVEAALLAPPDEAFEQVAVGAANVEQVTVGRDRIQDRLALGAPAGRSSVEAGLLDGIGAPEVRVLQCGQLLKIRPEAAPPIVRS